MQIQPGSVPSSGEEELQAPGQHIHLSLVSPRAIHCQWESLSLGGLSLCDSRTGDRTGWLGRRAGHGLRGQAAWATPLLLLGVALVWASVATAAKWRWYRLLYRTVGKMRNRWKSPRTAPGA